MKALCAKQARSSTFQITSFQSFPSNKLYSPTTCLWRISCFSYSSVCRICPFFRYSLRIVSFINNKKRCIRWRSRLRPRCKNILHCGCLISMLLGLILFWRQRCANNSFFRRLWGCLSIFIRKPAREGLITYSKVIPDMFRVIFHLLL